VVDRPAAAPVSPPPAPPPDPVSRPPGPVSGPPVWRDAHPDDEQQLSVRPLRSPAPAVTTIRVAPVPVDGFEYQTASLWFSGPRRSQSLPIVPADPDPLPLPPSVTRGTPAARETPRTPGKHHEPPSDQPVLSWLDE
jgi:hypothetical protein